MMLDSGITSHMTPCVEDVVDASECNVSIAINDDSVVKANLRGTRHVNWAIGGTITNVSLSNTLVSPDLSMGLLSIPALAKNMGSIHPGQRNLN